MFLVISLACTNHAQDPIEIYAAVSVAPVLEKVISSSSSTEVYRINSASSSLLAQQIKQGAKADIFASASVEWVHFLESTVIHKWEGLTNKLVLIKNKEYSGSCSFDDKTPLSIADWTHVPAGIYAKKALEQLSMFEQKKPYMVPSLNAHAALAYVASENIPCGIVYRSDAQISNEVDIVPSELDSITMDIRYSIATLSDNAAALELWNIIKDPKNKSLYEDFGLYYRDTEP